VIGNAGDIACYVMMMSVNPSGAREGITSGTRRPDLISRQSLRTACRAVFLRDDAKLTAEEAASTLFRFFRSRHVRDLRLIFGLVVLIVGIVLLLAILCLLAFLFASKEIPLLKEFVKALAYILPTILTVGGAVMAWTYLSASTRLGVVDLFACEISTLCRVASLFDVGTRYVEMMGRQSAPLISFVSQEEYFPVFANNSRDLESLEATVVAHITEFYTYMKATRDTQRGLADIVRTAAPEPERWRAALVNLIYVLFLGCESGRKAVKELIEFEPSAVENVIVILLTEVVCYSFLRNYFPPDDVRHARLKFRMAGYEQEIRALRKKVNEAPERYEEAWTSAKETMPELQKRYAEGCGKDASKS